MNQEPGLPSSGRGREVDVEGMERALEHFLSAAGHPDVAAGEAPGKTAEAWREHLLSGYGDDPVQILRPTWKERSGQVVAVTDISFVSVCAHHLLPFFGKAHVLFLPDGELTGLSRIEDMIHCLSRRLQLQERLGEEIAEALFEGVGARGTGCVLEAEHLCVFARGRRQRGATTRTIAFAGAFSDDTEWQDRCVSWLASGSEIEPDRSEVRQG